MERILPNLLRFPPDKQVTPQEYEKRAEEYVRDLQMLAGPTWKMRLDKKPLTELLNPAVNSIPYLYMILDTLYTPTISRQDLQAFLPILYNFFEVFDPIQMRYIGSAWTDLVSKVASMYLALSDTDVSPLGDALLRLDPTGATFTTNYLTYLRLCLQIAQPRNAFKIIDKDIRIYPTTTRTSKQDELLAVEHESSSTFINNKTGHTSKVTVENVLEYNLLVAFVCISARRWNRARTFLEYVLLHPSPHGTTSAFQVEAYKKWVLVGLLAQGRQYDAPRGAGQQVMKNIRALARPYETLAESFDRRDWKKFQAEMQVGSQVWTDDGNSYLVSEASTALLRYSISDLQKMFASLPVSRVASHLSMPPDQTVILLNHLIQQKRLDAHIDSTTNTADPTLCFDMTSGAPDITDLSIAARSKRIEDLVQHVRDADRRLQLSSEYIEALRRTKRVAGSEDIAEHMDLDFNAAPVSMNTAGDEGDDEDIMS